MLKHLFNPESIAVIGASRDRKKVGYAVLNNLVSSNYTGKLYPINPTAPEIFGIKAYPSLAKVAEPIDLAVVCVPAKLVPHVMEDCGKAQVKAAVIITAGFKEIGHSGLVLEQEMLSIAQKYGIRVLGPNCLGVINSSNNMNASFGGAILKGRTALFSQSGALAVAIMDWALEHDFGFSKLISLGNKSDLNEVDFLEYFINDPETDIVLGYIEDVVAGKRFMEIAAKATQAKPVILIKAGGTEAGARAASSHTGALAGSETAFRAAFNQTGVIRANGIQDLFDVAMTFASGKLPTSEKVLIITNAGGPGIIATDAADRLGLALSPMSRESIEAIESLLPPSASIYNPIDLMGDATSERYSSVLSRAVHDDNVDGIVVLLTPQAVTDVDNIADIVIQAAAKTEKPIITAFMGGKMVRSANQRMREHSIPTFHYPEAAIGAYRKLCDFSASKKRERACERVIVADVNKGAVREIITELRHSGHHEIGDQAAMQILMHYGFSFPQCGVARTSKDARKLAERIGFPIVMKIASPDILHKTDLGGVKLNIDTPEAAEDAFTELTSNARRFMPEAYVKGVTVCEMIREGKEIILGVTYDRTFGHMIMFGLGGIYVEVMKSISFRIAPVSRSEAYGMINELKSSALLRGTRGEKPVDIDAIVDGIMRISALVTDFPEIRELDINPIKVMQKGAYALDSRLIFEPPA